MLTTASLTSGFRLREQWSGRRAAVAGVLAGGIGSTAVVLALGLVPLDARNVIAVGGILIGNSMSAATLAGRSLPTRDTFAAIDGRECRLVNTRALSQLSVRQSGTLSCGSGGGGCVHVAHDRAALSVLSPAPGPLWPRRLPGRGCEEPGRLRRLRRLQPPRL